MKLYDSGLQYHMSKESQEMVVLNLQHFINTLAWCKPAFRDAEQQMDQVRVPLFDWYMAEDYYIGRHDPALVIMWQMEHDEVNLCTVDVMALGE